MATQMQQLARTQALCTSCRGDELFAWQTLYWSLVARKTKANLRMPAFVTGNAMAVPQCGQSSRDY